MINMSAGVLSNSLIYKSVVTIPQADVLIMDSLNTPYTIFETNNDFFCIPVACYVYCINQSVGYTGFTHLHITNISQYVVTGICGSLAENALPPGQGIYCLGNADIYSLLINFQQAPARYGGRYGFKQVEMFWDTAPTTGDGDMIVTLLYTIQERF